ncbi:MAG: NAD(P)-dependent malic enzyme, partial [Angustibacter sp.]
LPLAYTPGVAQVCRAIADDPALAEAYTGRARTVAVVSDGTAVLGLGNIGPLAALPVMEGKALLFQRFGQLNAVPICLATTDVTELVDTIARLAPSFGGINLEDISAPRCFDIEEQLQDRLDIPVFHDDQHGTAVVVLAAAINAAKVIRKIPARMRVVISGAGAAGIAVARILIRAGFGDVVVCDSQGVLHPNRADLVGGSAPHKAAIAAASNPRGIGGSLTDALAGAQLLIGLSGGTISEAALGGLADDAIIFALANPHPEVHPDLAHRYAAVVATGRSDFPNQINNVLAFPGIFKGALEVGARRISEQMKLAAAQAISALVEHPTADHFVPSVFDPRVVPAVATMVSAVARTEGLARS